MILHQLIQKHIPQIHYLEMDTSEAVEGECILWQSDCTCLIELDNYKPSEQLLNMISQQITWLNQHQNEVLAILKVHDEQYQTIEPCYLAFLAVTEKQTACNIALSCDDNVLAHILLQSDNQLIFDEIEPI